MEEEVNEGFRVQFRLSQFCRMPLAKSYLDFYLLTFLLLQEYSKKSSTIQLDRAFVAISMPKCPYSIL